MEPGITALVLIAAVFHAGWNAAVKMTGDRLLTLALVMAVCTLMGVIAIPFVGFPAPASWIFLLLTVTAHTLYHWTLLSAYRYGDLSQVYPIARGVAPVGVAVLGSLLVGQSLSGIQWAAVLMITIAIWSLALSTKLRLHAPRSVLWAVLTGICIASYTVIDGMGARAAGEAMTFIAWQFAISSIPLLVYAWHRRRGHIAEYLRANGRRGALAGLVAGSAYGIVIWAMSVTPFFYISSLRETSVVIAALIGSRLLGEPFGNRRIAAAAVIAIAIVVLTVSPTGT